ncbi:unnamed protein product [Cylicocyclus nassatus]|uniref:Uncharacterized protein n=1 Tax=Cylicocyclus nassatus TaxID=53992 RepID=A0AA36M3K4_CYLNA|nr:unnamed protein product [Cylicocyclus nassatus]
MTSIAMPEEELGKKLVEIRAKCFNVTVAVQKHTGRYPWCPDPSDVTIVEQRSEGHWDKQTSGSLALLRMCIIFNRNSVRLRSSSFYLNVEAQLLALLRSVDSISEARLLPTTG